MPSRMGEQQPVARLAGTGRQIASAVRLGPGQRRVGQAVLLRRKRRDEPRLCGGFRPQPMIDGGNMDEQVGGAGASSPGGGCQKQRQGVRATRDGEEDAAKRVEPASGLADRGAECFEEHGVECGRAFAGAVFAGIRPGSGWRGDQQLAAFSSSLSLRRTLSLICG